MFCPRCGTPTADSAKFCPRCGQILSAAMPYMPPVAPVPPPKPRKKGKGIFIAVIAAAVCVVILGIGIGTRFFLDGAMSSPDAPAEKSESLFDGLIDYEFSGFLFRTPDDIYWEDEYLGDGEIILDAEDFSVYALAYNAKALKNMDIRDEDDLIDFAVQRWSAGDYDVESFSSGHYIVVDGEAVIGVYMQGKQGWLIAVEIHDSSLFYDYLSLAEFIATGGIITEE